MFNVQCSTEEKQFRVQGSEEKNCFVFLVSGCKAYPKSNIHDPKEYLPVP
jgi:hypothetical protein